MEANSEAQSETEELSSRKFNVMYLTAKWQYIFKASYNEVCVLADAFNNNLESVRIAGDLIRINTVEKIKFFTIEKVNEMDSDLSNAGIMHPDAKKYHNIGIWSYEKLCYLGKDVTSDLMNPLSDLRTKNALIKADIDLDKILNDGESKTIEFKSRLRWDSGNNCIGAKVEYKNIRAIASLLNTFGGMLLIGVNDKKEVVGIQDDLNTFPGANKADVFRKHFDNLIASYLGNQTNSNIHLEFKEINNQMIALVQVRKSAKPVYLDYENKKEFIIRRSATSIVLNTEEAVDYIKEHWI